jgi:DNA polymerase elongation subunit (family B)
VVLEFQTLAWNAEDEVVDDDDDDVLDDDDGGGGGGGGQDGDEDGKELKTYVIRAYGVTRDGDACSLAIRGYTPHFYVKMDPKWTPSEVKSLTSYLRYIGKRLDLKSVRDVMLKDFYGFRNGLHERFLRLDFKTHRGLRFMAAKLLQGTLSCRGFSGSISRLYESNMDPMLRFMHDSDVSPAGWIKVPRKYLEEDEGNAEGEEEAEEEKVFLKSYKTFWKYVEKSSSSRGDDSAPAIVMSFDIECNSSHGDFPAAKKDYTRLANELPVALNAYRNNCESAAAAAAAATSSSTSSCSEYSLKKFLRLCLQWALGIEAHVGSSNDERGSAVHQGRQQQSSLVQSSSIVVASEMISRMNLKEPRTAVYVNLDLLVDDLWTSLAARGRQRPHNNNNNNNSNNNNGSAATAKSTPKSVLDILNASLPPLCGDEVIQIGATLSCYGHPVSSSPLSRHIFTLSGCSDVPGATVHVCATERELLLAWARMVKNVDPDILLGYNIMGFDMDYMYQRAEELKAVKRFCTLLSRRGEAQPAQFKVVKLSSAAYGDNEYKIIEIPGRIIIDVMVYVRRNHTLDSYKLDAVAEHFTGERKNDVSPKDIFRLQRGSDDDRARIAAYCVQDCELVMRLAWKLEILANNIGMANVCTVPLSFIFMRGQGIKVFSLVAKHSKRAGFVIPAIKYIPPQASSSGGGGGDEEDDDAGYEGAIVLEPKPGIYMQPVTVLDFASLYPSSMISENLSHDSIVLDARYDNLPGVEYKTITYDKYEMVQSAIPGRKPKRVKAGVQTCRFAQTAQKGVIPRILEDLISQRKATRKLIEHKRVTLARATGDASSLGVVVVGPLLERRSKHNDNEVIIIIIRDAETGEEHEVPPDATIEDAYSEFQKAVLDGLQLAYKVTANSLYGAIGARVNQLYLKDVAACTTATGRRMILEARDYVTRTRKANVIYGDTDSIFCIFPNPDDDDIDNNTGRDAIARSIQIGEDISRAYREHLPPPHNLEYDKTFWPLALFSKKRYVGHLYEHDPDREPVRKSMGIALKRRDSANIVKVIYGGVIDIILQQRDIPASVAFLKSSLEDLVAGRFPVQDLVMTKALHAHYADPTRILHKALADRMGARDPGNKPQPGDRIPYVFVVNPAAKLQGDRVEHPAYAKEREIPLDYRNYIESQIMNPIIEMYAIVLEELPGYARDSQYWDRQRSALREKHGGDLEKVKESLAKLRKDMVRDVLFTPFLKRLLPVEAAQRGNSLITSFFQKKNM